MDIVLATLNARYSHTSVALRYVMANLGDLQARARMLEFDLRAPLGNLANDILAENPRVVGLGVYIWNVAKTTEVVRALRARRPELVIVLGGPEVSCETDQPEICALADYVVTNEGEVAFADLCRALLQGRRPDGPIVRGGFMKLEALALPYQRYTDQDIAGRVIYVEASRGCPFSCEFCLSSLDVPVRRFPLETLLPEFDRLLERGVRQFKFLDRTFNLSLPFSLAILDFFLTRYRKGLFLHMEIVPDRLPDELLAQIARFPAGALQFEVGIQTFNEEVAARIQRRQDFAATERNLRWLREHTGVYLHADLILGLPGESLSSIAAGFDRLLALRPHEIQVNLLKRLRGTPIIRHDREFGMRYSPRPPYELLENCDLPPDTIQRLQRFARFWDLYANSGNFAATFPLLWADQSPFASVMAFSESLFQRWGKTHAIPLEALAEGLFDYLKEPDPVALARSLWSDLSRGGRRDMPLFLRRHLPGVPVRAQGLASPKNLARQARRMG